MLSPISTLNKIYASPLEPYRAEVPNSARRDEVMDILIQPHRFGQPSRQARETIVQDLQHVPDPLLRWFGERAKLFIIEPGQSPISAGVLPEVRSLREQRDVIVASAEEARRLVGEVNERYRKQPRRREAAATRLNFIHQGWKMEWPLGFFQIREDAAIIHMMITPKDVNNQYTLNNLVAEIVGSTEDDVAQDYLSLLQTLNPSLLGGLSIATLRNKRLATMTLDPCFFPNFHRFRYDYFLRHQNLRDNQITERDNQEGIVVQHNFENTAFEVCWTSKTAKKQYIGGKSPINNHCFVRYPIPPEGRMVGSTGAHELAHLYEKEQSQERSIPYQEALKNMKPRELEPLYNLLGAHSRDAGEFFTHLFGRYFGGPKAQASLRAVAPRPLIEGFEAYINIET